MCLHGKKNVIKGRCKGGGLVCLSLEVQKIFLYFCHVFTYTGWLDICVYMSFASLALETEVKMSMYITLNSPVYTYRTRRTTC
jgi:hypothetical protein